MAKKPSGGIRTARERSERRRDRIAEAGGKVTSIVLAPDSVAALERAAAAGIGQTEAINSAVQRHWPPPPVKSWRVPQK